MSRTPAIPPDPDTDATDLAPWLSVLRADKGATLIPVFVQPRASRTKVVGLHDGRVKIAITAPPVDGAANKALIKGLARILGCSRADLTLVRGDSSRRKMLRADGISPSEVAERLLR